MTADTLTATDLVKAFREVMEPAAAPRPELVTVGENSDPKLDVQIYCPQCLSDRGSPWPPHSQYWWAFDPERPERPKRNTIRVIHPDTVKTMSYDQVKVREGLKAGTHGRQCLQCGRKLLVTA